jgi:uncharacterized protein YacL
VLSSILLLGVIVWLGLGVAVGSHAKGHNRSGIIWFFIVAITGIVGVAIYLLAITSASSEKHQNSSSFDSKVTNIISNHGFSAVVGAIIGMLVGFLLGQLLVIFDAGLDSLGNAIAISVYMLLIGAIIGPLSKTLLNKFGSQNSGSINPSRRRAIGMVGKGTLFLNFSLLFYSSFIQRDLRITNTYKAYEEQTPVVVVEMDNPQPQSVTVKIDVSIWNEGRDSVQLGRKTVTLASDSNRKIDIRFDDSDFGPDFQIDDDISFSVVE